MTAQEVGEIFPRGAAAELLGALIKRSRAWWVFGIPAEVLTEVTARLITLPGCVFWLDQQMSTVLTVRQSQGWGPDMCRDLVAMLPPSANAVGVLPQAIAPGQISAALKGFPGLMAFPSKKVEEHHPVRCHRWHGSPRRYSDLVVSRDRDRRPAFSGIPTRAGAGAVTWGACFLFELDHVDVTSRGAVKALIDALARLPERSWSNWTLRGKDGALVTRVTTGRDVELPVAALAAVAEWRPVLPTPVVVARIQPRPSWLPDIIAYPTIEECVKINAVLDGDNKERTRHG